MQQRNAIIYTPIIYIQGGYHVIRFIKPIMIFSFLSAHLVAQNVCPPRNLEVTPGVGTVTVSWENPGIYSGEFELSPQPANYHTGSVTQSGGFSQTSRIKSISQEVGWATFDISSLPANVEPITVDFNFHVYSTYYPYWSVTPVTSNPLNTVTGVLYQDIIQNASSSTDNYGNFTEEADYSVGDYTYPLTGPVFADIASAAASQDWFTIGIVDYDFSDSYFIFMDGWAQANPPSLTVTYGDGQRHIVPAIPNPGISADDIAAYKQGVENGTTEEIITQHTQVIVTDESRTEQDCLGAVGYYVFMDGDTLIYTSDHEITVQGTIGQEYCFFATAQYRIPDSTMILTPDSVMVIDSTSTPWDTSYNAIVDTTYNINWLSEWSTPSDTVCSSPVEFLLCPPIYFSSISTYSELTLDWIAPFLSGHAEYMGAWGGDWGTQWLPTEEVQQNVTKFDFGLAHILVLKEDSTTYALTNGWTVPFEEDYPQLNAEDNQGFVDIASGSNFNIGLRHDGTMLGWWDTEDGQSNPPDSVTDVTAIAAGYDHALALRSDSTVVAWGTNLSGQTDVPAGLNNVIQIDAGGNYSAALRADGTVVAWGENLSGQTSVPADLSDVVSISCGSYHMLVLKSDGSVLSWGQNAQGQTDVPNTLAPVEMIAAGGFHSAVVQTNGQLVAWGDNSANQTTITQTFDNIVYLACSEYSTAVIVDDQSGDCGTLNGYTIFANGDSIDFTTSTQYSITSLQWGEEVCYNIAGNYNEGVSAWSDTICTSLITPALCTTDTLVASSNYDAIELYWPNRQGELCGTFIGYCVYQDGIPIDTIPQIIYTISNAEYDSTYCYYVTTLYEEGESVTTDTVCISLVTPQFCLPDTIVVEPGDRQATVSWSEPLLFANNNVGASASSSRADQEPELLNKNNLDVEWETVQPVETPQRNVEDCGTLSGYIIYQDGDSIDFVASEGDLSYTASALDNGVEYCFSLSAVYEQGVSINADEVCVIPFAVHREHNTGVIEVTFTNEGNIGYTHWKNANDSLDVESYGLGFQYVQNNYLFEAGLMIGVGQDQISDCIRNDSGVEQDEDFVEIEDTYMYLHTPGSITDEEGSVMLDDSGADNPIGLRINQTSYADGSFEIRNGVIFHYTLVNESGADLTGLHAGLFFDWDLEDHLVNNLNYNSDYQMIYVQDVAEGPQHFAGTMLLNRGLGAHITGLHSTSADLYTYDNESKWSDMTGGVNDEPINNANVASYVGVGPIDIAAGDSVSFGIAALASSSIYELEYVASELQGFWDIHFPEVLGNVDEAVLPIAFAMHQNYPNPFNPVTSVRYDIPSTSEVTISVYSLLGQKVKTLTSNVHQPGFYSVQWNGTNDMGAAVSSGVYICKINAGPYTSINKMILMK